MNRENTHGIDFEVVGSTGREHKVEYWKFFVAWKHSSTIHKFYTLASTMRDGTNIVSV